jgi:galactokinase
MAPTVIAFAPGRVELLGNRTDYNDGVALAAAIDRSVTIRAEKPDGKLLEVSSEMKLVNHDYGPKSATASSL